MRRNRVFAVLICVTRWLYQGGRIKVAVICNTGICHTNHEGPERVRSCFRILSRVILCLELHAQCQSVAKTNVVGGRCERKAGRCRWRLRWCCLGITMPALDILLLDPVSQPNDHKAWLGTVRGDDDICCKTEVNRERWYQYSLCSSLGCDPANSYATVSRSTRLFPEKYLDPSY